MATGTSGKADMDRQERTSARSRIIMDGVLYRRPWQGAEVLGSNLKVLKNPSRVLFKCRFW